MMTGERILTGLLQTENDYLFRIDQGGYYGHPNPTRGEYVLGVPLIDRATLRIGDKALRIRRGPSGATLDGRNLSRTAVPHALLAAGGTLRIGPM